MASSATRNPVPVNAPAADKADESKGKRGLMFYMIINSLFVMLAIFYIFLQALNPKVVQQCSGEYKAGDACEVRPPDNAKCLFGSVVLTVVFGLLLWLLTATVKC